MLAETKNNSCETLIIWIVLVIHIYLQIVLSVFLFAGVTFAAPSPKAQAAFVAPFVAPAPAVVTATSSQVIARNYNGIAAPLVAASAPVPAVAPVAPFAAPYFAASPYAAYPAYSSPYITYVWFSKSLILGVWIIRHSPNINNLCSICE